METLATLGTISVIHLLGLMSPSPGPDFVMASVIMIVLTAIWFSLVAIFFTQKHVRRVFNRFQNAFNKTFGGLLILLGIKIATTRQGS